MNAKNYKAFIRMLAREQPKKAVPLITGATGIGKTEIAKQVAKEMSMQFISFSCDTLTDAADLRGGIVNVQVPSKSGKTMHLMEYSMPALIAKLQEHPTILLFDELLRTPPQSQNALMSAFTSERRLGLYQIPEHTVLIACTNPPDGEDYFGNELDSAQIDRFIHISYAPDKEEVLQHLKTTDTHSGILAYFTQSPGSIIAPFLKSPYKAKATPRSIEACGELHESMTEREFEEFGLEIFEGLLGDIAHDVIKSIKEHFEKPLSWQDLFSGKALPTLQQWTGQNTKIGLLSATLKNLVEALENNQSLQKKISDSHKEENPKDLESLAQCLQQFPADLLRQHVKEVMEKSQTARTLAAVWLIAKMKNTKSCPHGKKVIATLQQLRAHEEDLEKRIEKL